MKRKQLSNPFSTGGGGLHFEAHVHASYVTLMLTGGYAPYLPTFPIFKIKPQGKVEGFETDDLIVYVKNPANEEVIKLLGQVKHIVEINNSSQIFTDVINSAWMDFNNPDVFNKGKDVIALITSALNKTDYNSVLWILEQAKQTSNFEEFFRYVKLGNFSPSRVIEKLEVIRFHLQKANDGNFISDETLYDFLNHFNILIYDLGKEEGVALSLLHSHISQFNNLKPRFTWGRIVDFVLFKNQVAGVITIEKIPQDIKEEFIRKEIKYIPKELEIRRKEKSSEPELNQKQNSSDLALINFVGKWNEINNKDISIINRLINKSKDEWLPGLRELLHISNSSLTFNDGLWTINDRESLWLKLGSRIFDEHLEKFKVLSIEVLSEINPLFEIKADERYLAGLNEKKEQYSFLLRKGISEGLALLENRPDVLIYCTKGFSERITWQVIHDLFMNASWQLWGSLNDFLPILAEANPEEFLSSVENALILTPCPFDELFAQEGNGITGSNYMTGLLWALETIAWEEDLLIRTCVILANLAKRDPGGNWANRPINSLLNILLPWLPQTISSVEKRNTAVQTIYKETPDIAWNLILQLLPNQHQTSSGSHKPKWRKSIPEGWNDKISNEDYWAQVNFVANLSIEIAKNEPDKLVELIKRFDDIPVEPFNKLIEILADDSITSLEEKERLKMWQCLISFTTKHRRYSYTDWALSSELVSRIENVSKGLAPREPQNLHQHLFNRDFELYEENDNWEEQEKKLRERRKYAVQEILNQCGFDELIQFVESVTIPRLVGESLGLIGNAEIDFKLFPKYLDLAESKLTSFIEGYIWFRHFGDEWSWADNIEKESWSSKQICQFLKYLPFTYETWIRVEEWLGESESNYWTTINPNAYHAKNNLNFAIDKFILFRRPNQAIVCLDALRNRKQELDLNLIIQALNLAITSKEFVKALDVDDVTLLIEYLQQHDETNQDDLFRIEWNFIELLDYYRGVRPVTLENQLANKPEFFCEIIQIMFKSNKDENVVVQSEEKISFASRIWRLLRYWKIPPGLKPDKSFDKEHFDFWIDKVKEICLESGHWEVAQMTIGEVLIYSPIDASGLWIDKSIADALNKPDANDMRKGFSMALFNSRGAHFVDPTGKGEIDLAHNYRKQAEEVESAGYYRLAITLRELASSYDREAERVIEDHKKRDLFI